MANRNTWNKRRNGHEGYGKKRGRMVDSAGERAAKGKKRAKLPAASWVKGPA